jgi:hypothetical protein
MTEIDAQQIKEIEALFGKPVSIPGEFARWMSEQFALSVASIPITQLFGARRFERLFYVDTTAMNASGGTEQTRVIMLHAYARELNFPQASCPFAPINEPNWSFHELSHDLEGSPNFSAFKTAKAFLFQLAGELAAKLRAIPEPSPTGSNMLDHTIIYIPTEIGLGHTWAGLQFVTLGGRGLGVNTGRYLQYGVPTPGSDLEYPGPPGGGVPHQRLHVAILNALGIADSTFGDTPQTGSGPIANYLR